MAKRRHNKNEELMLIPFLDILCSLIGVLVLIIVVLCVAQTQKARGRSPEEIERSQQYVKALKQKEEQKNVNKDLKPLMAKLQELEEEQKKKAERLAKLRLLVSQGKDIKKANEEISMNLLKELDNLMVEIRGLAEQQKVVVKEIAELKAELAKRQIPPDKKPPPVVVQPGGSGMAQGSKIFFVEASGNKLTIFWDKDKKTVLTAANDVIATDTSYEYFLKTVSGVPNAKILFLLRDDGLAAYNRAAGWAQQTHNYKSGQIGRLPIPGKGDIDLSMFKEYVGSIPPPPGAALVPPPAPAKA